MATHAMPMVTEKLLDEQRVATLRSAGQRRKARQALGCDFIDDANEYRDPTEGFATRKKAGRSN
jgi:hypothetical protein